MSAKTSLRTSYRKHNNIIVYNIDNVYNTLVLFFFCDKKEKKKKKDYYEKETESLFLSSFLFCVLMMKMKTCTNSFSWSQVNTLFLFTTSHTQQHYVLTEKGENVHILLSTKGTPLNKDL